MNAAVNAAALLFIPLPVESKGKSSLKAAFVLKNPLLKTL
jgi:hypothetical protein